MSLMGKPSSAAQLKSGDVIIIREKSSMCVFGPNGRDKRVIKETLSKPCCIALDKDSSFLVLDYDLKTAIIFSTATFTKTGQVSRKLGIDKIHKKILFPEFQMFLTLK